MVDSSPQSLRRFGRPSREEAMAVTQGLPPCRAIFAVDTVKFTRNPSAQQPGLSDAIPELLSSAFQQCGLAEIWDARRFPQSTGDGYAFGTPQEDAPFLL